LVKEGLCANFAHGRFDGKKWRCYEELDNTETSNGCVDHQGKLISQSLKYFAIYYENFYWYHNFLICEKFNFQKFKKS